MSLHQLGQNINVMWSALTTTPDKDDASDLARPMIPGAQGDKLAASCDFVLYFRVLAVTPAPGKPGAQKFEIRTRRHGRNLARGRDSGVLPDPLPFHTFRELRDRLNSGVMSSVPPPPTDAELEAGDKANTSTGDAPAPAAAKERSQSAPRNTPQVSPGPRRTGFKI